MPNESWAVNIDIEGFSKNYEESDDRRSYAIWGLHQLMDAIIKIGRIFYSGEDDRIFAHQYGDGFLITSDFYEQSASRAIAVSIALMRHMLMNGYATKSAISTGGTSDIKGCYPEPIRDSNDGTIYIGAGIMTTIPVMGTALTRAHKLSSIKSGSQLILDTSKFKTIPDLPHFKLQHNIIAIDWLSCEFSPASDVITGAGLRGATKKELLEKLNNYIQCEPVPPESWVASTFEVLAQ